MVKPPPQGYDPYNSMMGMPRATPQAMQSTVGPNPRSDQIEAGQPAGPGYNGADPYNSVLGTSPPTMDEAGSVPTNTDPKHAMIIRAMHNAYANKGVNPYDSHPEMKKKWERAWKDKANRDAIRAAGGIKTGKEAVRADALEAIMKGLVQAHGAPQGMPMPGMSRSIPIRR